MYITQRMPESLVNVYNKACNITLLANDLCQSDEGKILMINLDTKILKELACNKQQIDCNFVCSSLSTAGKCKWTVLVHFCILLISVIVVYCQSHTDGQLTLWISWIICIFSDYKRNVNDDQLIVDFHNTN